MKFNREMFLKNDFRIVVSAFVGISFLFIIVAMILGLDFNGTVNTIQRIMFLSAVYAMVVLALNLQWGYAGIFNIGVAGFMLSGVYTMAIITAIKENTRRQKQKTKNIGIGKVVLLLATRRQQK